MPEFWIRNIIETADSIVVGAMDESSSLATLLNSKDIVII